MTTAASEICAKWFFSKVGDQYLHYGGPPDGSRQCISAFTQMYLDHQYCSTTNCMPCKGGADCHCEPINGIRGRCDKGMKSTTPLPPDGFGEEFVGHEVMKMNFKDWRDRTRTLWLYKVNLKALNPAIAKGIGKDFDYLAYQVADDASLPGPPESPKIDKGNAKCASITITGTTYHVLLDRDKPSD